MRYLIRLEHISLDGVIQADGVPDEDTSGGFAHGRWIAPYWPQHASAWPGANTATKYVTSNSLTAAQWQPPVTLTGNIAGKVARIKQELEPDLHVWGRGNLLQTLIRRNLVDVFWLMIYPTTLRPANACLPGAPSWRPSSWLKTSSPTKACWSSITSGQGKTNQLIQDWRIIEPPSIPG